MLTENGNYKYFIALITQNDEIIKFARSFIIASDDSFKVIQLTENQPIQMECPGKDFCGLVLFDVNNPVISIIEFHDTIMKRPECKNFYFLAIINKQDSAADIFNYGFYDIVYFPAHRDEWIGRLRNYLRLAKYDKNKDNENTKNFFQFILDVIPIPIFYKNSDNKIEFCNNAYEVYTGLSRAEIIDKTANFNFPLEIGEHINEQDAIIFKEKSSQIYEYYAQHADGTLHNVIYYKSFAEISFQSKQGIVGAIFDITERKHSEKEKEILLEKIQTAYDRLHELTDLKDNFLSIASHDLRAPFNAILGYTQILLEDEELNETQRAYIDFIQQSAEIQLRYVNDILNIIRIEKGNLSLDMEFFPISEVIRSSILNLMVLAEAKNISIKTEIDFEGELYIDLPKITQVMNNLISNAIKYTMPGGNINVKTSVTRDDFVEIHVADNGIGLSKDSQSKLFDYYQQAHIKGTSGEGGHGLGLAICKNFIELHGGKIFVDSSPEKGSDFYFTLPLYPDAVSVSE